MSFHELRAMSIPEGLKTDQLEVTAWVQDTHGRILAATRSACQPEDQHGTR